jgi:hypothetical protein
VIDRSYPPAREGDQVDNYHGELVQDPYRWLENSDDPEKPFRYQAACPERAFSPGHAIVMRRAFRRANPRGYAASTAVTKGDGI